MTDTRRQLVRAWALFGGSLVGWIALMYLLSLVPPRGVELPIALHVLVLLILLVMFLIAIINLVSGGMLWGPVVMVK